MVISPFVYMLLKHFISTVNILSLFLPMIIHVYNYILLIFLFASEIAKKGLRSLLLYRIKYVSKSLHKVVISK